jgi:chemotaxis protein MotB
MAYKKKPAAPPKSAPHFMTTYGDMVTLLLCFFVMLYSISNIDADKFKLLAESLVGREIIAADIAIGDNAGNYAENGWLDPEGHQDTQPYGSNETQENHEPGNGNLDNNAADSISGMVADFEAYLSGNDITAGITVEELGEFMRLRLPEGIMFESGSAELLPEAYNILEILMTELLKYPDNDIRVEGHTCSLPINTDRFPNNLFLSSARADTVVMYFIERGFSPHRFTSEGRGEWWPIESNDTPEGRAMNRRVEIKVFAQQASGN